MAEVAGEIDDLHSSVPLTPSSQQPQRAILASVINQNHFARRGEIIEHPTQAPLKLRQRLHLVVDRYDNRESDALCAVHGRSPLVLTGTKWFARLGPGGDLSRDSRNLLQRIALQRRVPMRNHDNPCCDDATRKLSGRGRRGTMAARQRCLQRLSAGRPAFEHVTLEPPAVLGDRGRRARRPTLPP